MLSKKITIILFLGLTIFSFAQCKTTGNKTTQKQQLFQPVSPIDKDMFISKLNEDKSMVLHLRKIIKQGDPAIHFEYKVYNSRTKGIIKEGTFRGATIDWNDNTSLKLIHYVGIEQKPSSENPKDALLSNSRTQITIIKLKTDL